MSMERLQKVMARLGAGSRRACEDFIRQGRVKVDGRLITELGTKVDSENARITLDGNKLSEIPEKTYLAIHKPLGVVTTAQDPMGRKTVLDLLPTSLVRRRVVPVGRLDMDSEGLLLLTNDGALVYGLTHPKYGVNKEYKVILDKPITLSVLNSIESGVRLIEGTTAPATIVSVGGVPEGTEVVIRIHEGKKRQIRRMFAAFGFEVTRLIREAFGPIRLDLPPSGWRHLTNGEILTLQDAIRPKDQDS